MKIIRNFALRFYKVPIIDLIETMKKLKFVIIIAVAALAFCIQQKAQQSTQQEEIQEETVGAQLESIETDDIEMPAPLADRSEQILRRKAYTASYNKELRCPNWVAWHLTAAHSDGPLTRLSNFHEDEEVPEPRATLADYRKSGWSRGHMCPAGDNKWDKEAMYESFALTNICPQHSSLNSGLWNSVETDCRQWARRFGDIYIVCGPVLMKRQHQTIGENRVVVPEAFFKVVLCLNGEPKGFGIIARNTAGTKKKDLYYNTIDEVERITGIDFFPALPDDIEDQVEGAVDMKLWQ